jgi:glutamate carboxypeptidase
MIPISEAQAHTSRIVSLLRELVEIESPTHYKAGVDQLGARVAVELAALGAHVEISAQHITGNHVIGRWGESGQSCALLLCHMDTVHPVGTLAQNPCAERDGKLSGPGTQDMKASIAIVLSALRLLQEKGLQPVMPVTALFTSDEEIGSDTSRSLIENLARQAALVLCMEPSLPGGELKTWRKGVGDFEVVARGRASHAGAAHAEGRNAIIELAHQLLHIQGWTDYERGTTLNVGVVRGGVASNVVPSEARAVVDLRVMIPEEAERIAAQMRALQPALEGTSLEVSGGLNRPPMPRDATMVATFQKVQEIGKRLGLTLGEGGTGGGSDANFVAPFGVPVLDGLGAVGDGQHSEREYVRIDSLPERVALLASILTDWQ